MIGAPSRHFIRPFEKTQKSTPSLSLNLCFFCHMLRLWTFYRVSGIPTENPNSNTTLSFLCLRIFVLDFTLSYGGLVPRCAFLRSLSLTTTFWIAQQYYIPSFFLEVVCIRSVWQMMGSHCHVCEDWEVKGPITRRKEALRKAVSQRRCDQFF